MKYIKDDIRNLKHYNVENTPIEIKLDANEGRNIFPESIFEDDTGEAHGFLEGLNINLYPDNNATLLKALLGKYVKVNPDSIIVGNGSSEMIDLIMKAFVNKKDRILAPIPTFSMYSIYSKIYSANFIGITSKDDFSIDIDDLIEKANEINPKLILICNPNNPTGYLINKKDIIKLLNNVDGITVVDEAYMEFAEGTMIDEISKYDNLIVLRTLSKAFCLAGIRLGYMISNRNLTNIMDKVRAPYNLNSITQYIGIKALEKRDVMFNYVKDLKMEREYLYNELIKLPLHAYKSSGNFIFFKASISNLVQGLKEGGVLIRDFSKEIRDHYRVTVGNRKQNDEFIKLLKELIENENR